MTAKLFLFSVALLACAAGRSIASPFPPAAVPPQAGAAETVVERVAVGGQYFLISAGRVSRLALASPALVDVKLLSKTEIRIVGLKAGETDLTIWTNAEPVGRTYHLIVGPSAAGVQHALADISELRNVSADTDALAVTVHGHVSSLSAQHKVLALARASAEKVNNQVAVEDRRMVAVEIRFLSIATNTLKSLGINFQKLGNGFQFSSNVPNSVSSFQFAPGSGLSLTSSLPLSQAFNLLLASHGSSFASAISALASVNLAQILAEPTLLVRSGEDAKFIAGGKIPIPVPQAGLNTGITVQYQDFGVQLHVHATVLSDDRIVLHVNPEVSELDYENAITLQGFNIPAITVRSADSTIELGDGQSFVLAGLMFSSTSNIEQKLPVLGSLPIIGTFFKNSQNSGEQQELVIIATPHLVSPMARADVPKLPGEGLSYAPSIGQTLANTTNLDDFTVQHGLSGP